MKKATTVCATQWLIANINIVDLKCQILWPFMLAVLTGKILQNNSKGHWKVKIISIAAEGT